MNIEVYKSNKWIGATYTHQSMISDDWKSYHICIVTDYLDDPTHTILQTLDGVEVCYHVKRDESPILDHIEKYQDRSIYSFHPIKSYTYLMFSCSEDRDMAYDYFMLKKLSDKL